MKNTKIGSKQGYRVISNVLVALLLLPVVLGITGCNNDEIKYKTEYQVVTLDNGAVYFGKIGRVKSNYLLLSDVYSAQQHVSEDKKEIKINLIRRADDLNGPDFMQINVRHIVYIEPLNPDSKLGELIRKFKKAQPTEVLKDASKTSDVKDIKDSKIK